MDSDEENGADEFGEEGNLEEYPEYEGLREDIYEEESLEENKKLIEGLKLLLDATDEVPKRTMHERLRFRHTKNLSKIVKSWMNFYDLKGFDYYHFLMKMLQYSLYRSPKLNQMKVKTRSRSRTKEIETVTDEEDNVTEYEGEFDDDEAEKGLDSEEKENEGEKSKIDNKEEKREDEDEEEEEEEEELTNEEPMDEESHSQSISEDELSIEQDIFQEFFEDIKKEDPELIERLQRKEENRCTRNRINLEKYVEALKDFFEAKKRKDDNKKPRMCFLEKKEIPGDNSNEPTFEHFLKESGYPVPPLRTVPPEVFAKFGLDKETWEKDFPIMDEDDLMTIYEKIQRCENNLEVEEEDEDLLKLRGRFPYAQPWGKGNEEEGDNIELTKWEQEYWKLQEEKEKIKMGKPIKDEMELCQLMLVRSGTSWKQELGYTEGWSDTTRLGKKGRREMEDVAIKILKRGYKFDFVLTSTMGRSLTSADVCLSGAGQEDMVKHMCWELNPRHRGIFEGQTTLGTASRYGWLPEEWMVFTAPPPIQAYDLMPENITTADPNIPATLPRSESVFHVQLRLQGVWDLLNHLFLKDGKRTILVCAHKDSIEALLFHTHGFCPTDFTAWHPFYTTPIILMYYKIDDQLHPAFIDFLCDIDEADCHTELLTICWLERFIDQGLLDHKTLSKIKKKMDKGEQEPDIEEMWKTRFSQTVADLEKNAMKIGQKLRQMDYWLEKGRIKTPDGNTFINEDNTIFKEFCDNLEVIKEAEDPLSDVLSIKDQIKWIVNREIMTIDLKLNRLKGLQDNAITDIDVKSKELLEHYIDYYEKRIKERTDLEKKIAFENKSPEEKFKNRRPKCWKDLTKPEDWIWAARNKKLPHGFKYPRKLIFDDITESSIPSSGFEGLEEDREEEEGNEVAEEEDIDTNEE